MGFGQSRPPQPQQPQQSQRDEFRLRLGGLYPSKTGNALTGGINLDYVKQGDNRSVGEVLIEYIEKCLEENLQLRFLVFENNGKFNEKSPYTMHVTIGNPRTGPQGGQSASPSIPKDGWEWQNGPQQAPELPDVPSPEPTPRLRRGAPRRP